MGLKWIWEKSRRHWDHLDDLENEFVFDFTRKLDHKVQSDRAPPPSLGQSITIIRYFLKWQSETTERLQQMIIISNGEVMEKRMNSVFWPRNHLSKAALSCEVTSYHRQRGASAEMDNYPQLSLEESKRREIFTLGHYFCRFWDFSENVMLSRFTPCAFFRPSCDH
jgi:hypothetical protein